MKLLYGNVMIYDQDIETLNAGNWINDTIIEFVYEYLENTGARALYLRPNIVYLLVNSSIDTFNSLISDFNVDAHCTIFCPLNDNTNNIAGGSHWSLLVYGRNSFYYFDSIPFSGNLKVAEKLKSRLTPILGIESSQNIIQIVDIPVQKNGFDCGVYVIEITRLLSNNSIDISILNNQTLSAQRLVKVRQEIKDQIIDLERAAND